QRPAAARGRAAVQLPRVGVGDVVAHRLGLRPQAERPAREVAWVAEAPSPHGDRKPERGDEIRVDEHLRVLADPVVTAAEAERALEANGRPRQDVTAAAAAGAERLEPAVALGGLDG